MIRTLIAVARVAYRTHYKRQSLTRQGLIPWWVDKSGSSKARHYEQNILGKRRWE